MLLLCCSPLEGLRGVDESFPEQSGAAELSAEEQELLKLYHHSFDDESVDRDLTMELLHNICSTSTEGEHPRGQSPEPHQHSSYVFSLRRRADLPPWVR